MEGKDDEETKNSKFQIDKYISLFEKHVDGIDVNRSKRAGSVSFVEKHYKMDHPKRGKAIVFNHFRFGNNYSERKGTDSDVKNLTKALLSLGFQLEDITIHEDLKAADIFDELKKVKQEDHSDSDLLMVFVLSHGNHNDKVSAFDVEYPTETLWQEFTADKCPTLAGKPKIFFIIACRGSHVDQGQRLIIKDHESVTEVDAKPFENPYSYSIPIWSDFLYVFSTYKGYLSYRNIDDGTWYIQAFCEELSKANISQISFTDFLTAVNGRLSMFFEAVKSRNTRKQIPIYSSTLTKGEILFGLPLAGGPVGSVGVQAAARYRAKTPAVASFSLDGKDPGSPEGMRPRPFQGCTCSSSSVPT